MTKKEELVKGDSLQLRVDAVIACLAKEGETNQIRCLFIKDAPSQGVPSVW